MCVTLSFQVWRRLKLMIAWLLISVFYKELRDMYIKYPCKNLEILSFQTYRFNSGLDYVLKNKTDIKLCVLEIDMFKL